MMMIDNFLNKKLPIPTDSLVSIYRRKKLEIKNKRTWYCRHLRKLGGVTQFLMLSVCDVFSSVGKINVYN